MPNPDVTKTSPNSVQRRHTEIQINEKIDNLNCIYDIIDNIEKFPSLVATFNGIHIRNGAELSKHSARNCPNVSSIMIPKRFYSLLMFDLDFPTLENSARAPFLHWMAINISYSTCGSDTMWYLPPEPEDARHRYIVLMYEQIDGFLTSISSAFITHRSCFPLKRFSKKLDLALRSAMHFSVSPSLSDGNAILALTDKSANSNKDRTGAIQDRSKPTKPTPSVIKASTF